MLKIRSMRLMPDLILLQKRYKYARALGKSTLCTFNKSLEDSRVKLIYILDCNKYQNTINNKIDILNVYRVF